MVCPFLGNHINICAFSLHWIGITSCAHAYLARTHTQDYARDDFVDAKARMSRRRDLYMAGKVHQACLSFPRPRFVWAAVCLHVGCNFGFARSRTRMGRPSHFSRSYQPRLLQRSAEKRETRRQKKTRPAATRRTMTLVTMTLVSRPWTNALPRGALTLLHAIETDATTIPGLQSKEGLNPLGQSSPPTGL